MKKVDQTVKLWKSIAVRVAAKVDDCCGCNYYAYLTDEQRRLLAAECRKAER